MQQPSPVATERRPSGWSLLGRWLLLVLVVFDLVSSPLHAHAHDGDVGGDTHWAHAIETLDDGEGAHAEPAEVALFSHSLAALLPSPPSLPALVPILIEGWAPPRIAVVTPMVLALGAGWNAAPDHIPNPSDRHWRPDGRAPPTLHS